MPKKKALSPLLQVVPVDTLTVPIHVLAVITQKVAGALRHPVKLAAVLQYVSGGAIVAMLVPVHVTRDREVR